MGWIKAKYHFGHNWHFEPFECWTLQFYSYSFKEKCCFHDCIQAWSVGSGQPMHPIYPLISTHALPCLREWISDQKQSASAITASQQFWDKSGQKEQGDVANFVLPVRAESCGSPATFLFPLTLNSASESFQGRKAAHEPSVGHYCLLPSICLCWRSHPPCVPNRLALLRNSISDVPRHVSLEDLFPVCALAVRGDHFPPILDFMVILYSFNISCQNTLIGRLSGKEGNRDSHF